MFLRRWPRPNSVRLYRPISTSFRPFQSIGNNSNGNIDKKLQAKVTPNGKLPLVSVNAASATNEPSKETQETSWSRFLRSMESDNFEELKVELNKFMEARKQKQRQLSDSFSKRLKDDLKEFKSSIGLAAKVVNDVTGYSNVEKMKKQIVENDARLSELREQIGAAKEAYSGAVDERSDAQKAMNELLERKNSWNEADLKKFTELYKNDHNLDKKIAEERANLEVLEQSEEDEHEQLIKSIMNRYHEEQIWSDKARQFSTWVTILLMAFNVVLLVMVQLVFEPIKRARLVRSFEEKVKDLFATNDQMGAEIHGLRADLNDGLKLVKEDFASITAADTKIEKSLPETATVRLIPTGPGPSAWSSWLATIFGELLSPFKGYGSETYTISKHDFQYFIYALSSVLVAIGCAVGRYI